MNTGAFGEEFPYSNFHDLNMDWIIKIAKDFLDQYTHIQEVIEQGETSLETITENSVTSITNLTTESLQDLEDKKTALENALQAWYNQHSEDIANQLATAISDFSASASAIGAEVIASIPSDYTDFYNASLQYKGSATGDTSAFDTIGWWGIWNTSNVSNIPSGASIGTLLSVQFDGTTSNPEKGFGQIYIEALTGKIWYRFVRNGGQSPYVGNWIPISNNFDTDPKLTYRGNFTGDLNSITESRWCGIVHPENVTNEPSGASLGTFLSMQFDGSAGNKERGFIQFYIEALTGKVWKRFARPAQSTPYFSNWTVLIDTTYTPIYDRTDFTGDLNALQTAGMYSIPTMTGMSNTPPTSDIGNIWVIRYDTDGFQQIYISAISGRTWTRFVRGTEYYGEWISSNVGNEFKVTFIGDSITAGSYSDSEGSHVAQNPEWCYPQYIKRMYNCRIVNRGQPGATLADLLDQVSNIPEDSDIVTIMAGINDYMNGTTIGTISDTGTTSIYGILFNLLVNISDRVPNARIILFTPLNAKIGNSSTMGTKYGINCNYNGFTLEQLYTAMKAQADRFEVEFVDVLHNSPVNILNLTKALKDGIHPTKTFYKTLAQHIGHILF